MYKKLCLGEDRRGGEVILYEKKIIGEEQDKGCAVQGGEGGV